MAYTQGFERLRNQLPDSLSYASICMLSILMTALLLAKLCLDLDDCLEDLARSAWQSKRLVLKFVKYEMMANLRTFSTSAEQP